MKSLSNIFESKSQGEPLLKDEMDRYIKAMDPKLKERKKVQACLYLLSKYPQIATKEDVLAVRDGQFRVFDKAGVLPNDLKDLQKMLRNLGDDIKILPHFLNAHQRQALEANELNIEDITLDITTKAGREKTAKQYTSLVMKIAKQFLGHCSLDFKELVSAGFEGLTIAMNEYKTSEEVELETGQKGTQSFTQFAAWQIRYAILDEINENGQTIKQSDYMRRTHGALERSSIDATYGKDEDGDDIKIDRLAFLADDPAKFDIKSLSKQAVEATTKLRKVLDAKFSARDVDIFCRVMGMNEYRGKSQEAKAVASQYMISPAAVSQKISTIIKYIKSNKEYLEMLRGIIPESICDKIVGVMDQGKEVILETLISSDLYVLYESLDRWPNKKIYQNSVDHATDELSVDDALFIFNCLRNGREYFEKNYKKNKPVVIAFLNNLYPAENFKRSSDDDIQERMFELINYSIEYNIKW